MTAEKARADAKVWLPDDVAAYLCVTTATVYSLVAQGHIPAKDAKINSGRRGWKPATIIAWAPTRPRAEITNRARKTATDERT